MQYFFFRKFFGCLTVVQMIVHQPSVQSLSRDRWQMETFHPPAITQQRQVTDGNVPSASHQYNHSAETGDRRKRSIRQPSVQSLSRDRWQMETFHPPAISTITQQRQVTDGNFPSASLQYNHSAETCDRWKRSIRQSSVQSLSRDRWQMETFHPPAIRTITQQRQATNGNVPSASHQYNHSAETGDRWNRSIRQP